MEIHSFETLPQDVQKISKKLDTLERLLAEITQAPQDPHPEIMNVSQAAEFLNITPTTIRIKAAKRELPSMKRNGRLYFSKGELIEYLKGGRKQTIKELQANPERHLRK